MDVVSLLNLNRTKVESMLKNREQAKRPEPQPPAHQPAREVTDGSKPKERRGSSDSGKL